MNTNWGHQYRQLRDESNLTHGEIIKRSGVPRGTLSKFERGGNATLATVGKLLDAIGFKMVWRKK